MNKHVPRKRFGQNFLQDQSVISHILSSINPSNDEFIVEIGPGQGALTLPLLKLLGKLTVIELDRDLIYSLKNKCADIGQLEVFNQDVLQFNFSQFNKSKIRVVGNLPYNISTPLLFHLFEQRDLISDMVFMLQKEVVDRLSADVNNSNYSRLSVMAQYHCKIEKLFDVPPSAFSPAPKVMSSVLKMMPARKKPADFDQNLFADIVKQAFSQRRKMLRNNLSELLDEIDFEQLNISSKSRAQELDIDSYITITQFVQSKDNNNL